MQRKEERKGGLRRIKQRLRRLNNANKKNLGEIKKEK
jgi:hypothetical protein